MTEPYDPSVLDRSKAFDFVTEALRRRVQSCNHWPPASLLSQWAAEAANTQASFVPRFSSWQEQQIRAPLDYERLVASGHVPTREGSWHDLMNALVWMHFPKSKAVLNALQLDEKEPRDPRNGRTPRQNVAAHFDECGAVVLCDAPELLDLVQGLRWVELFWQRREKLYAHFRLFIFGHGLLDLLRAPREGLVAKALLLPCSAEVLNLDPVANSWHVDHVVADAFAMQQPRPDMFPIPVLGMPGWTPDQNRQFYGNSSYFRTQRVSPEPKA